MAEIELDQKALKAAYKAYLAPPDPDRPSVKDFPTQLQNAVRAYLTALRPVSDEAVGVKALEWREPTDHPSDMEESSMLVADGIGGKYSISHPQAVGPKYLLWWAHDEFDWSGFASVDEAKAAAFADYEKRFRSALSPQGSGS